MAKYTVYKDLRLKVEIEAEDPQDAYEQQLNLDDNTFSVLECEYEVFDEDDKDVSDEVMM